MWLFPLIFLFLLCTFCDGPNGRNTIWRTVRLNRSAGRSIWAGEGYTLKWNRTKKQKAGSKFRSAIYGHYGNKERARVQLKELCTLTQISKCAHTRTHAVHIELPEGERTRSETRTCHLQMIWCVAMAHIWNYQIYIRWPTVQINIKHI